MKGAPINPGVAASVSVKGAGYKVCILVNGSDIGVRGEETETRKLFSRLHALAHRVPQAERKQTVVLKDRANQFVINFKKTGDANDRLTVEVFGDGPDPVFSLTSSEKGQGKVNRTINLAARSVMTVTDADVK